MIEPEKISKLAYLLYPEVWTAGSDVDIQSLADKIRGIRRGLLPEDEFAVTAAWLGNCEAIHRIDQTPLPVPSTHERMRAPDFIAFPIINGRPTPVLIEVKVRSKEAKIDWSESYLRSLQKFAELLGVPLLVAWKFQNLWMLVEAEHFEKNVSGYRLTFEKAATEDLMSALFGDVRIILNETVELIIDFEVLDEIEGTADDLFPEGNFHTKIVGAGFYRAGQKIDYPPEYFVLRLAAPDETEFRRTGKQAFSNVYRLAADHMFSLSRVLYAIESFGASDEEPDWHQILARGKFGSSGVQMRDFLEKGIEAGFIRYVLDVVPQTRPSFLSA
jgi:Holliday junction resolvase